MVENSNKKISIINKFNKIIFQNLKVTISIFVTFFSIFIFYQIYSIYLISNINKSSVVYFNAVNMQDENNYLNEMEKLKNNKNFYTLISKLEIIDYNLKNKNMEYAYNLITDLLKSIDEPHYYKELITIKLSYDILGFNTLNFNEYIKKILLPSDQYSENFQGNYYEILYLISIIEVDNKKLKYVNNEKSQELYQTIMSSEKITPNLKERVNKIHEFYLFN